MTIEPAPVGDNTKPRLRGIATACLCAASLLTLSTNAGSVVSPKEATAVEGNVALIFPFDIGQDTSEVPDGTMRYQQVFRAADFSSFAPGGELIVQIAFRPDANAAPGVAFSTTLSKVRIDLSTTSASPDLLSKTFSNNVGADNTIVFGGPTGAPLTLSSNPTGPNTGPKQFDVVITLTKPFLYNPAAGNLMLDIRNLGGGSTTYLDAQDATDGVSRVCTTMSGAASSTADVADSAGLVTQFVSATPLKFSNVLFLPNGEVCLKLLATPNQKCVIEGAPSFRAPLAWTTLSTNVASQIGEISYTNSAGNGMTLFRARTAN
jgi:hypothetical protein